MRKAITVQVDEVAVRVPAGSTVAAAILRAGKATRTSITGQRRATLCGMGTCMECRVTVDGRSHVRSCQVIARDGMVVKTT